MVLIGLALTNVITNCALLLVAWKNKSQDKRINLLQDQLRSLKKEMENK